MNKRRRDLLAALDPAVDFALKRDLRMKSGGERETPPGLGFRPRAEGGAAAELMVYGTIGAVGWWSEGITASDVAALLKDAGPGPLNVRINSGGGDVFDGVAIHSLISRHPGPVSVYVDGLAASAASFIMLAGDTVYAPKNAFVMIHDAMTMPYGNSTTLRTAADLLDQVSGTIAEMYADRAGEDVAYWREQMTANGEDGTWFNGQEAYDAGLVDEVIKSRDGGEGDPGSADNTAKHLVNWQSMLPEKIAAHIKFPSGGSAPEGITESGIPVWDRAVFKEVLRGATL